MGSEMCIRDREKIDVVKSRLIKDYGYNEESANDVLSFVASIFARGDANFSDYVSFVMVRISQS